MFFRKTLILIAVVASVAGFPDLEAQKLLFIRGGAGTGGFLEGGADEQLCNMNDYSTARGNHGWGELADVLTAEGYSWEQVREGPAANNTHVRLDTMDLDEYGVIVFASNNAGYPEPVVDSVENYIRRGGAALFISDANWGRNWGDAPASDQAFIDRFGWEMNQDQGTYSLGTGDFKEPGHPVLTGVSSFDGEGVSPITLTHTGLPGIKSTILAPAKNTVRRNTGMSKGPSESPAPNDASLIVATVDSGRIAGHFDRNTFFNLNGAGTNIQRHSNKAYARNLFAWLSGRDGTDPGPDTTGQIVDTTGQIIDTTGQIVDTTGQIIDTSGQIIDTTGQATGTDWLPYPGTSSILEKAIIYPNPAGSHFEIRFPSHIETALIEIYSLSGHRVHSTRMNDIAVRMQTADLHGPGIYYIRIINGRASRTYKLVVH